MGQLASNGVPADAVAEVTAAQWKTRWGLRGASKDDSRELAARIMPGQAEAFKCARVCGMLRLCST